MDIKKAQITMDIYNKVEIIERDIEKIKEKFDDDLIKGLFYRELAEESHIFFPEELKKEIIKGIINTLKRKRKKLLLEIKNI